MPRRRDEEHAVPIHEEVVTVSKRPVERARLRIDKRVSAREVDVSVPLVHEDAVVERVSINRVVSEAPPTRQEGDTLIIPVVEEVAVVERRLVLREEVRVQKRSTTETFEQSVTVRSESVEVSAVSGKPDADGTDQPTPVAGHHNSHDEDL
jgi:uncharacterized protein (TIGR02271 family)